MYYSCTNQSRSQLFLQERDVRHGVGPLLGRQLKIGIKLLFRETTTTECQLTTIQMSVIFYTTTAATYIFSEKV